MKLNSRHLWSFMGFFLALILQTTVLKHIAIMGYSPNIILCLVVVTSFLYDEKIGLVYGVVFGLLLDLLTGIYVGPSAIGFAAVYLFVIFMRTIFNHERLLPELLLAAVSTPLYQFIFWAFYKAAGNPVSIFLVLKALPVLVVYNGIVIILLHLLLVRGVIRHRQDARFKGKYELHSGIKI